MQNTTNYNLNKPEGTDFVKVEFLNENADIIDDKLKELEDGLNNIDFSSITQQIATHTNNQQIHVTQVKQDSWTATTQTVGTNKSNWDNGYNTYLRFQEYGQVITNWNNAIKNGFYMAQGASNAPDSSWFMGTAIVHADNFIVQKVMAFTEPNETMREFERSKVNGVWGAWIETSPRKLFQSVSNGKAAIANAITQKGVATSATAEFATMAANISNISQGPKTASGTATSTANGSVQVNGLGFTPTYVRLITTHAGGTATYHFYYPLFGSPSTSGGYTVYPTYGSGDSITSDQTLSGMYQGGFQLPTGVTNSASVQWLASDGILF